MLDLEPFNFMPFFFFFCGVIGYTSCSLFPLYLSFTSCLPPLSSDLLSLTLKQESLFQCYAGKDETAHHGVALGDNYGWSNCLCVCACVCFICVEISTLYFLWSDRRFWKSGSCTVFDGSLSLYVSNNSWPIGKECCVYAVCSLEEWFLR